MPLAPVENAHATRINDESEGSLSDLEQLGEQLTHSPSGYFERFAASRCGAVDTATPSPIALYGGARVSFALEAMQNRTERAWIAMQRPTRLICAAR